MKDFILTFPDEDTAKTVLSEYIHIEEGQIFWDSSIIVNATRWITRPIYETIGEDTELVNTPEKVSGFHVIIRSESLPEEAKTYIVSDPGDIEPLPFGGLVTEPVPESVDMAQCRLELLSVGITASDIESMLATIEDDFEREAALIQWEYKTQVHRNNSLVLAIQSALGWSDSYVDERFISAAKR